MRKLIELELAAVAAGSIENERIPLAIGLPTAAGQITGMLTGVITGLVILSVAAAEGLLVKSKAPFTNMMLIISTAVIGGYAGFQGGGVIGEYIGKKLDNLVRAA